MAHGIKKQILYILGDNELMDISRRLGILVFCGVPAIIGGGIVYAIFDSFIPVFIYEAILLIVAGGFFSK